MAQMRWWPPPQSTDNARNVDLRNVKYAVGHLFLALRFDFFYVQVGKFRKNFTKLIVAFVHTKQRISWLTVRLEKCKQHFLKY